MRTEDVLAATGTGIWTWDHAARQIILDATAARLLGLSPDAGRPVRAAESALRACFHVVDFVELNGIITLAVAEGRIAEAMMRVVDRDGSVLRTVRTRLKPRGDPGRGRDSAPFTLVGTVTEVAEPSEGQTQVTGDWRRSREAFLLDAGRALAEARSTSEVLRVAAALSMPGFSPDGLAVFGVDGDRLSVIGHHGHGEDGAELPFLDMPLETPYPAADVVRSGRAVYLTSPAEYQRRYPTTWPLAERFNRQSWAFLPLVVAGRTTGAWMAAFAQPAAFSPDERAVLTTVARMLAQALSRAYLHESERELADGLQRTMRPAGAPDVKGLTVAARYVPTGGGLQVGGDWYDVIPLPSGRTALVIGDVQGHDVRAAGIMSQLRIALRAYAAEGHRPEAVLSRASRFLAGMASSAAASAPDGEPVDDRFATCLYIEADPLLGTMDIARAGHLDPAVLLADGTLMLRPTAGGLPLGITPGPGLTGGGADGDYPTTRLVLEPGETLLVCTDGLIETGGHDAETGWARLREVLDRHRTANLEEIADELVRAVHGPPSHHTRGPLTDRREDDIALLLVRRGEKGVRPATARRTVLTISQADASRVADARHQLQAMLYDWGAAPADAESIPGAGAGPAGPHATEAAAAVDGAVLMLSEILTNVLIHTEDDALMVAEVTGQPGSRRLRVEVSDHSDELPHRRDPGELASSGRGLVLMDLLAGGWGVDPRGEGKVIWFEMREDAPP
ncbi:SpoIIE family protein phosphatase, partial [Streptomyces durbertensis]